MRERIRIPIRVVNGEKWADLNSLGKKHLFCGYKISKKDDKFSFAGGHRVRLYSADGNVHFKIPTGIELDISNVSRSRLPPRRRQDQNRGN